MRELVYKGKEKEEYLRPDEMASQSKINRSKETQSLINKGASTALGFGAATAGAALTSKILPFLSEHIPLDLAMKGISKISPKMGEYLRQGQKMGLDVKEGLGFLKEKMQPKQSAISNPAEEPKDHISVLKNLGILNEVKDLLKKHTPKRVGDYLMGNLSTDMLNNLKKLGIKNPEEYLRKSVWKLAEEGFEDESESQQQPIQQSPLQPQQPQQGGQMGTQGTDVNQSILAALDKIMKM